MKQILFKKFEEDNSWNFQENSNIEISTYLQRILSCKQQYLSIDSAVKYMECVSSWVYHGFLFDNYIFYRSIVNNILYFNSQADTIVCLILENRPLISFYCIIFYKFTLVFPIVKKKMELITEFILKSVIQYFKVYFVFHVIVVLITSLPHHFPWAFI